MAIRGVTIKNFGKISSDYFEYTAGEGLPLAIFDRSILKNARFGPGLTHDKSFGLRGLGYHDGQCHLRWLLVYRLRGADAT